MTKDDQVEEYFEDLSFNDKQNQETPFYIVLVDIKKTVQDNKIRCVEKPLKEGDGGDLNYVALSYRWGELQETMVDTECGYVASVTSFDLFHFIHLCKMILLESDLKDMDYVWVDAICVDQANHDRRKATIYQMTNIYEQANYILAVPDLHLQHLKDTNALNMDIINGSYAHHEYIYHLIHGNTDQLVAFDETFLDRLNVPIETRPWLINYTEHFTEGFTNGENHRYGYDAEHGVDHIYHVSQQASSGEKPNATNSVHQKRLANAATNCMPKNSNVLDAPDGFHCDEPYCPLRFYKPGTKQLHTVKQQPWKQTILERSQAIRKSMTFLQSLIVDWSSRVWVISEYSIAKKNNNLKYWFIQLSPYHDDFSKFIKRNKGGFTFFAFDFNDERADEYILHHKLQKMRFNSHPVKPVKPEFHLTMSNQLKERTFLEMMLRSKASKCEDRFYSVLPISKYKEKMMRSHNNNIIKAQEEGCRSHCQQVWNIHNMVAVKLQLFEWMDTKDKLNLLFLAGRYNRSSQGHILPTFATTVIPWKSTDVYVSGVADWKDFNFDVTDPSTVMLYQEKEHQGVGGLYFIHLKPKEYILVSTSSIDFQQTQASFDRLGLTNDDDDLSAVKIRSVASFIKVDDLAFLRKGRFLPSIYLIGSFKKNKWMLHVGNHPHLIELGYMEAKSDGFKIY
ncbi:hypothetical protein BCR42DRAFT_427306 [Absidia repens]|uniref:Heterokaryon incompatibility domain-containing protein n=1 Tax=Absidia repens TaxID=90262 RepID=A0A1X2HZP7_9FUNG|nr:hypothetical protein BCR42DRAFT_427306 [Absidia repens]